MKHGASLTMSNASNANEPERDPVQGWPFWRTLTVGFSDSSRKLTLGPGPLRVSDLEAWWPAELRSLRDVWLVDVGRRAASSVT